jgi:hypothetical protein
MKWQLWASLFHFLSKMEYIERIWEFISLNILESLTFVIPEIYHNEWKCGDITCLRGIQIQLDW